MAGASVETTLELWASSLRDVKARLRLYVPCSVRSGLPYRLGSFWTDFLATNCERRAGCARRRRLDSSPWRQQAILARGRWHPDALREIVREYALETLAEETAWSLTRPAS
jgi:hypothetical protein